MVVEVVPSASGHRGPPAKSIRNARDGSGAIEDGRNALGLRAVLTAAVALSLLEGLGVGVEQLERHALLRQPGPLAAELGVPTANHHAAVSQLKQQSRSPTQQGTFDDCCAPPKAPARQLVCHLRPLDQVVVPNILVAKMAEERRLGIDAFCCKLREPVLGVVGSHPSEVQQLDPGVHPAVQLVRASRVRAVWENLRTQ